MADAPSIREHYASTAGDHPPGVYRVVGVGEDTVTLLRLTDGAGNRRATGEVVRVPRSLAGFDPAADPDAGIHLRRWLRNQLTGVVWALRMVTGV